MNKNIFEIQDKYLEVLEEIENYCEQHDTDEPPAELLNKLTFSVDDLHSKLDAYHHRELQLKSQADILGAYIKRLQAKKKKAEQGIVRLKQYAGVAIEAFGEQNKAGNFVVQTDLFKVTAQRSKKLVIDDLHQLPDKYLMRMTVEQVTVDSSQLKQDLIFLDDLGENDIKGAYIDRSSVGVTFR